jgi:hypothetical protein
MSYDEEDDKPTVILDLAVLKRTKLKQEEDLASVASELEFSADHHPAMEESELPASQEKQGVGVILFDFQSKFFASHKHLFPQGNDYVVARNLEDLNQFLRSKKYELVVFNYDVNPKAVNQLSAQVKKKFPHTAAIIMARAISPEKAKLHAKTPYGASGYYQFPLESGRIEKEFHKVMVRKKKSRKAA